MSLPTIPTTWPNLFRSIQGPLDGIDCEIVGTIPSDLAGNFVAMGPSLFDVAGRPVESWFDGQGGMHRFQIDGGSNSATAWSKVVESNDYRDEQDAGVQTINHFAMNTPSQKPGQGVRTANTSNTQAFVWRNELFALYEGGWPVQMDPSDLSTPDDATRISASSTRARSCRPTGTDTRAGTPTTTTACAARAPWTCSRC